MTRVSSDGNHAGRSAALNLEGALSSERVHTEFITAALSEVLLGDDHQFPLRPTVDRFFAEDFVIRVDGEVLTRELFIAGCAAKRSASRDGRLTDVTTTGAGDRFSVRHVMTTTRLDGTVVSTEAHMFVELDSSGRIRRIDELTFERPDLACRTH